MQDVDEAVAIDRHAVRRLPGKLPRQLRPIVVHFVAVVARAEHDLRVGLAGGGDGGAAQCGSGSR